MKQHTSNLFPYPNLERENKKYNSNFGIEFEIDDIPIATKEIRDNKKEYYKQGIGTSKDIEIAKKLQELYPCSRKKLLTIKQATTKLDPTQSTKYASFIVCKYCIKPKSFRYRKRYANHLFQLHNMILIIFKKL